MGEAGVDCTLWVVVLLPLAVILVKPVYMAAEVVPAVTVRLVARAARVL